MSGHQLHTFLGLFDRSTPAGRRDYAMALCQTDLGFRVGEVAALKLDDIDWRGGTIRILAGKTRRGRVLPLTDGVGQAIADYLRHGRPATLCRHVFVRHTVPPGTPVTRHLISHVFRRAFARVEGCENWKGTHVLRHTAATRMYSRGANLKEIADILGHRSLSTTAVYAKVEPTRLATVALPWPEEVRP
jgi:integrase